MIFDDISNELKLPSIRSYFKAQRHRRCMTITSSQYILDLLPESIKQQDVIILFGGMTPEKLEKLRKEADLELDYDMLKKIYDHATAEKYNFLYIDVVNGVYRKNFNKQYVIQV
jgi:hypothetical protein